MPVEDVSAENGFGEGENGEEGESECSEEKYGTGMHR